MVLDSILRNAVVYDLIVRYTKVVHVLYINQHL
jgi:hypothetical protein